MKDDYESQLDLREQHAARASDTQKINKETVFNKVSSDYYHFSQVSDEESMMNLLFEADLVNRQKNPEGVISQNGSAILLVVPDGMTFPAFVSTSDGNKKVFYKDNTNGTGGYLYCEEELNQSEKEVLLESNKLLLENTKRQIAEFGESRNLVDDITPSLISSVTSKVRANFVETRENRLGYSRKIEGWDVKYKLENIVVTTNGDISHLDILFIAKKDATQLEGFKTLRPEENGTISSLDMHFVSKHHYDHPENERQIEMELIDLFRDIEADLSDQPETQRHYANVIKELAPSIKNNTIKRLKEHDGPVKSLKERLVACASALEKHIEKEREITPTITSSRTR